MSPADYPTSGALVPRRRKILSVAALCLGVAATFPPVRSGAAEPDTAPAPATPAPNPADLAALNARLQELLGQLRPYNIPHLDEISTEPAATTVEELARQVDRLYVETAFQSASRYRTYEDNLRGLTDERVRLEEARVEYAKLEKELAAAPDRVKTEEARSAQLMAQAASEERLAATLRDNAAVLEQDFLAARGTALGSVYYLLPTNQRVTFHEGTQKNANNSAYIKLDEVEPDHPARTPPAPAKPAAAKPEGTGVTPPPPVAGSLEDKFAAFADKQRALRGVAGLLPPQEKQLAASRELADAQQKKNDVLTAQMAEFAGPLGQSAAAANEAEDRILTAQVNQKISAGNLLRLGTSAVLWSYLKESIVAPQMENFLQDNGLKKIPKGPALLEAINQRPQDFIPKSGAFENTQALTSLKLKLLDVEPNLELRAQAATEALEGNKLGAGGDLLAHFFKNLDKQGIALLRATTDTLEPAQQKIAQALLKHAPAE
jgi:hypothetical protein